MASTKLTSLAAGFVLLVAVPLSHAADGPEKPLATSETAERPTVEQLAAIDKLQHEPPTSIEGRDLLQAAMMRKESEPLAEHLVQLVLKDARRSDDFIVMIANRAASLDRGPNTGDMLKLGIDGPYLKTAALAVIDSLENPPKDRNHQRTLRSSYGVQIAIAYLRFHPDNEKPRQRLVNLAEEHAKLPPPVTFETIKRHAELGAEHFEPNWLPAPSAWQVLLELGVLHPGMTVDEAIKILGPPSGRSGNNITWYISTPRHVNPGLSAKTKDGKIQEFGRFMG